MKEIFYFIRDKDHKPVISVCLLLTTGESPMKVGARGVAICSDRDTPCSKLNAHQSNGPGIARRRAWKVWKAGKDMYEIKREKAFSVLNKIPAENVKEEFFQLYRKFKAFYKPTLSPKEQRILAAIKLEVTK